DGLDKPGARRVVAKRIAQARHGAIEALIEFYKGVSGPDAVAQLFATHDLTGKFQKQLKDFERLVLQLDPDALFTQLEALQVEFEYTELHDRRTGVLREHCLGGTAESLAPASETSQKVAQMAQVPEVSASGRGWLTARGSEIRLRKYRPSVASRT